MNNYYHDRALAMLFLAAALASACCAFAFQTAQIRWTWNTSPILTLQTGDAKLELGLRSDGTVVWREVFAARTNSPAEQGTVALGVLVLTNDITIWTTNSNAR